MKTNSQKELRKLLKIELSTKIKTSIRDPMIDETFDIYEWRLPNGDLHREFGPAIETEDGREHWFLYGKDHREDGPSYSNPNSEEFFYDFHGQQIKDPSHLKECVQIRDKALFGNDTSFTIYDERGHRVSLNFKGEIHNEEGPAVIHREGSEEYYLNDVEYENQEDWLAALNKIKHLRNNNGRK